MVVHEAVARYFADPSEQARHRSVQDLVNAINTDASMLDVVRALEPQLTSDEGTLRAAGVELFNQVLERCNAHCVNDAAMNVLVQFYINRLADDPSIDAVLAGMLHFSRFRTFTGTAAGRLLASLYQLNVHQYPQTTRYAIFRLLDWIISSFTEALQPSTADLSVVSGFIQVMDGEKDPRNLLLAFSISRYIMQHFDITSQAEDIFDVIFCYFPITFRPPPNDPYGITADDLKLALRGALSATPLFAPLAMPMLLEKLSSSLGSAKKDALDTIAACAPVYGADSVISQFDSLWTMLKTEIFEAMDDSVTESAVLALTAITKVLAAAVPLAEENPLQPLLSAVLACCKHAMKDAEPKNLQPAASIIRAVAGASKLALEVIVTEMLPHTLQKYQSSELPTNRKSFLIVLLAIVRSGRCCYGDIPSVDIHDQAESYVAMSDALMPWKDQLIEQFSMAYSMHEYDQLRHIGLSGCQELLLTSGLLLPSDAGVIIQQVAQVLLKEKNSDDLREKSLALLADYAERRPVIIRDVALPPFLAVLSDALDNEPAHYSVTERALTVIAACAAPRPLFEDMVLRLEALLDHLSSVAVSAHQRRMGLSLLETLLRMCQQSPQWVTGVFPDMLLFLLAHAVKPTVGSMPATEHALFQDPVTLQAIARLFSECMHTLDETKQQAHLEAVVDVFVNGRIDTRLGLSAVESQFAPLTPNAPPPQQRLLPLLASIICYCRPKTVWPMSPPHLSEWVISLAETACSASTLSEATLAIAQCIASILNKLDAASRDALLPTLLDIINMKLAPTVNDLAVRQAALTVLAWSTRALVLLAHPEGRNVAQKIVDCFTDQQLQKAASDQYYLLIAGASVDCLTTSRSFAVSRLLYAQKFFIYALPMITDGFAHADQENKVYYLIALSHLLSYIPKQIMLDALPPLIPLLMQSLQIPSDALRCSTLRVFSLMAQEASHLVADHVSAVLGQALKLSCHTDSANTMAVRIAALQLLTAMPAHIRYDTLHPHKMHVLRELTHALDDPKRAVRKEAVLCRHEWFMLGAK